jgi:OmpA-OmpF porin, OOP family
MVRQVPTLALGVLVAAACFAPARPAHAQKLIRDYQFKQSLKDTAEQGPELKTMDGTLGNGVYTFEAGQGLQLEKTGVTDQYTVEITFRFNDVESWQKVIDFKNRTSDNGLYIYNGKLQFYDFGIGGDFQAGQDYRVRLDRDKNTNLVRGFINDLPVFEFTDTNGDATFENGLGMFFVDDTGTNEEVAPGAVSRIRIWDGPGAK